MENMGKVMTRTDIVDSVAIGTGTIISLQDVQSLLSIIILIFNVVWILCKFGYKMYKLYKEKKYKKMIDEIENTKNELQNIQNNRKESE